MVEREVWRTVPSLPQYKASSLGRIMRIPYEGKLPHGGKRRYGGQPWKGTWAKDHRRYLFRFHGKTYKVSRIVCEAFHGPPPFAGAVAMHIDENAENNKSSNLKWGTQKKNLNAPGFLEYCRQRTGKNNPFIKGRLLAAKRLSRVRV